MKRTKGITIFAFLLLVLNPLWANGVRLEVNTGHIGPVSELVYAAETALLFSGSEDGTVRIWDPEEGLLLAKLQISHLPVTNIAIDPKGNRIAIASSNGKRSILSVWNWKQEKELYIRDLADIPLTLKFSPKGSFIVYSQADWKSLHFIDTESGDEMPYLEKGFGIVSFVHISDSEKTLITYNPSTGAVIYWDLENSREKTRRQIPKNLEQINMLDKGSRYIAAADAADVVVANIVTGEEVARTTVGTIIDLDTNTEKEYILCLSNDREEADIDLWRFYSRSDYISKQYYPIRKVDPDARAIALVDREAYSGARDGVIARYSQNLGTRQELAENKLDPVSDLQILEDRMVLSTKKRIHVISSDFFTVGPEPIPEVRRISERQNPAPFVLEEDMGSIPQIEEIHYASVLLWNSADQISCTYTFSPDSAYTDELFCDFESPLLSVDILDSSALFLQRDGSLTMRNIYSGQSNFEYTAMGLQDAVLTERNGIVAGKNITNVFESSLIRINPETGETVGLDNEAFIVFDLAYDEENEAVYSLGLSRRDGSVRTILNKHSGYNLESQQRIMAYEDEDLNAGMAVDPENGYLYSSLGYRGIKVWDRNEVEGITYERSNHIPRDLFVNDRLLLSINRDGTVSVWSKQSGDLLLDFYFFTDNSWLALTSGNFYYASDWGYPRRYLSSFKGAEYYPKGLEERLLELPIEE